MCRERGWYRISKKVDEEAHALLSTGRSSCHFAAAESEEGEEERGKKMKGEILRAKGNKNTRAIMLELFNLL